MTKESKTGKAAGDSEIIGSQKNVMDNKPNAQGTYTTLLTRRVKISFVLLMIVIGLMYFAWTAFDSATVNFAKVSDVIVMDTNNSDNQIGVIGKLVDDSYVRSSDGITARFSLVDEDGIDKMQVLYKGEIGQIFFNKHSEIIVRGQMSDDMIFVAESLTVRCPTKYLTEQERIDGNNPDNITPSPPPYQSDYFDKDSA